MPSTFADLDRRSQWLVGVVLTLGVVVFVVGSGFLVQGAWDRAYVQVTGEEELPATNSGLGRAVAAMHDLHYLCTEGKSAREGLRAFVCTGPEGRAELEATTVGKVTYLALIGRGDEMTMQRAGAVGRVLVNAADLGQDAKIAARSITDGRAELSTGPWGTAMAGAPPYRLVYVGADRPKVDRPAALGPAAALSARLAKQTCTTVSASASPSASASGKVSGSASPIGSASPSKSGPPAGSGTPAGPATPAPGLDPSLPQGPVTTCSSSSRLVTTTVSYVQAGDQVTSLTVRSSAPFAFAWTHTETIRALREALTDLGQDGTDVGDWATDNSDRQGTVALGPLIVDLNHEMARSVTSVTVTRVP